MKNCINPKSFVFCCDFSNEFLEKFVFKVQNELDQVLGDRKVVSLDDKSNLPYTNAVLMESMRIATIVPMALPHFNSEDMEIAGYLIPKVLYIKGRFLMEK